MPPKFTATPQDRIDAVKLVAYELRMLRECAARPRAKSWPEKSVWIESLVLHARVLRDFFFTKHDKGTRITKPRDIVAVDYFGFGAASWPYTSDDLPKYLKANKHRMDWALAHLSFGRLGYIGKKKHWSAESLRSEIGDKWIEFVEKLHALKVPAAAEFLSQASQYGIPVVAPF